MKPEDVHTLAGVLTSLDARVTMLASALRAMADAETLAVQTVVIPPSGAVELSWRVEYHAISVTSQSTQAVTLSTSPAALSAPVQGVGVAVVGPNRCAVFNIAGHVLSVYGKPGDTVTIGAHSKPQPPSWGS